MSMRLGSYTFYWKPDKMSIPKRVKPVGRIPTFGGSSIFQWAPLWSGTEITLEWNYMPVNQYESLHSMYLSPDQYEFNPDNRGETFYVIITSFSGEYIEVGLNESPYRWNVKMTLEIRTQGSTTSTSSTTTTTA